MYSNLIKQDESINLGWLYVTKIKNTINNILHNTYQ